MIETLAFGRTGHASSRIIFGAAALSSMSQESADRLLPLLREFGVNHLDTAAGYGDSELRLAPWLKESRSEYFLASKTGQRDGPGARRSLEDSLRRLGVDQLDLIQLHNLVEEEEWEQAHGPGGALEALIAARDEGLVRFIGVTGHGLRIPAMHLRALERFDYASVLFPYNHSLMANSAYATAVNQLVEICQERQVAIQTIKSAARRRWPDGYDGPRHSWYEPIREPGALSRAVRWVLAAQGGCMFVNTSSEADILRIKLEAASSSAEIDDELLARDEQELGVEPIFDGAELERI